MPIIVTGQFNLNIHVINIFLNYESKIKVIRYNEDDRGLNILNFSYNLRLSK